MKRSLLFFALFLGSFSASADYDETHNKTHDDLNAEFLEFLADLENIDNAWTHPVDFDDRKIEPKQNKNAITTTETNNE